MACADRIREFIAQFDVPHSLKEAKIPRDQIQRIAGPVHDELNFAGVVERPITFDEVAALIEAIYDQR